MSSRHIREGVYDYDNNVQHFGHHIEQTRPTNHRVDHVSDQSSQSGYARWEHYIPQPQVPENVRNHLSENVRNQEQDFGHQGTRVVEQTHKSNGVCGNKRVLFCLIVFLLTAGLVTMIALYVIKRREHHSVLERLLGSGRPRTAINNSVTSPGTWTTVSPSSEGPKQTTDTDNTSVSTVLAPPCDTSRLCHACTSHSILCPADGQMETVEHHMVEQCACDVACYSDLRHGNEVLRGCVQGKGSEWIEKSADLNCQHIGDSYVCFCRGDLCNERNMTEFFRR